MISFRQETRNGVEAITVGESPRAPRNEGQGPVSTHGCAVFARVCVCVDVCVCLQGPAGDLLSMRPHDLFTVPLSNLTLHKHTHGQTHDF